MQLNRWFVSFCVLLFAVSAINACRFQQLVRYRRKSIRFRTRKLRPYFSQCLTSKAEKTYKSWNSIVDFVVLDTHWFTEVEDGTCAKAAGRNNTKCWRSAVKEMLRSNSALLPYLLQCMKHRKLKENSTSKKKEGRNSVDETSCASKTIPRKYENCFKNSMKKSDKERRRFHLASVLEFLEDHWICENPIMTKTCFTKSNVTCHTQSWLRRMARLTKPTSPIKTILNKCNAKIFPRPVSETCEESYPTLGMQSSVMTSPGYPDRENHNFDCLYRFESQISLGLELKVEVDTESCCDFVTVFLKNSTVLAKISGNVTRTFEVDFNVREIFVQYHTDENVPSKGFRINRRNVCKYNLPALGSVWMIHPPTYYHLRKINLQTFGQEMECKWTITASPGTQAVLYIERIRMSVCCEQLEVFDGAMLLGNYTIAKSSNIPIVSTNGSLTIRYYTNSTKPRNGFRAHLGRIYPPCHDEFRAADNWTNFSLTEGQLIWRGYKPVICYWYIRSSPGYAVVLNITAYGNIPPSPFYELDIVEIFDGPKLVKKFINDSKAFVSSENRFAIRQYSYIFKSFALQASYKQVPCNVTYNLTGSASMKLASPDYEGSPFNIYQRCTYTLHAQPGKNIQMSLQTFTRKGFVEVLSGDINFGRASGVDKTFRLTSSRNTIQLHYTAPKAFSAKRRGFVATYRQVRIACGSLLETHATVQPFSSLGYRNKSSNNVVCDRIITTSPDNQISLAKQNLELDGKQ
ncbi:unnamed protein product [Clavelina lepadiformis]|uniref:CUB domain-containing protein n=1 Tax=Clavelina lepadiformis TaxID=159417 RepID=A0ABP0G5T7_CLALP